MPLHQCTDIIYKATHKILLGWPFSLPSTHGFFLHLGFLPIFYVLLPRPDIKIELAHAFCALNIDFQIEVRSGTTKYTQKNTKDLSASYQSIPIIISYLIFTQMSGISRTRCRKCSGSRIKLCSECMRLCGACRRKSERRV